MFAFCKFDTDPVRQLTECMVLQVISNRMQKSVLVAINYMKKIPKYKVSIRRTTKLMV